MSSHMIQQCLEQITERNELRWVAGNFPVACSVLNALPKGSSIQAAQLHGNSNAWFATGRIEATDGAGKAVRYFVKYAAGAKAHGIIAGEFRCAQELCSRVPASTPCPIAWGSLDLTGGIGAYFLVLEFIPFSDDALPDVSETAALITSLHNSAGSGPSSFFGTSLPTYDGIFCHMYGWESSWTRCFSRLLSRAYHYNCLTNGVDLELQAAYELVQRIVIPRLLGRLESGGNSITPCFIHGDLWEGNIRAHKDTGKLYIFDSNGFYAHHEMELACWRTAHHKMHERAFCEAYFAIRPPSAPVCEVDDRLELYALKAYLMYSAHARGHASRINALESMQYLVEKHATPNTATNHAWVEQENFPGAEHSQETLHIIDIVTAEEDIVCV